MAVGVRVAIDVGVAVAVGVRVTVGGGVPVGVCVAVGVDVAVGVAGATLTGAENSEVLPSGSVAVMAMTRCSPASALTKELLPAFRLPTTASFITGSGAEIIKDDCPFVDNYVPHLVIKGIVLAYMKQVEEKTELV